LHAQLPDLDELAQQIRVKERDLAEHLSTLLDFIAR
jgi:hypothetical protein